MLSDTLKQMKVDMEIMKINMQKIREQDENIEKNIKTLNERCEKVETLLILMQYANSEESSEMSNLQSE